MIEKILLEIIINSMGNDFFRNLLKSFLFYKCNIYRLILHRKAQGGKISEQMQIKEVEDICHMEL